MYFSVAIGSPVWLLSHLAQLEVQNVQKGFFLHLAHLSDHRRSGTQWPWYVYCFDLVSIPFPRPRREQDCLLRAIIFDCAKADGPDQAYGNFDGPDQGRGFKR